MADEVTIFETFFRAELLTVSELVTCVEDRVFNSIAPPGSTYPYAIFQVVPLNDNTGQARTSIQTRLFVDHKILSTFPLPDTVGDAVAGVKEHFRSSFSCDSGGCRISVRHERPISYIEQGLTADQRILHRGGTFAVWMHRL